MVICCVPDCGTDSWRCDGSVTFYDFPSNPDLRAKWIKQINTAIKSSPMWFPRGRSVICSKHFLHTDFKGDTDALKPRCIPTVFGYKYIGQNPESNEIDTSQSKSPLIVKVLRPATRVKENDSTLRISDVFSKADSNSLNDIIAECKTEVIEIDEDNSQASSYENINLSNSRPLNKNPSYINKSNLLSSPHKMTHSKYNHKPLNNNLSEKTKKTNTSEVLQHKNNTLGSNGITANNLQKRGSHKQPNPSLQKNTKKKVNNSDLIEIGPNTFLKINPDVIKVHKKQTPSGNTVLQFLMDQKLAKNFKGDVLPTLIQGVPSTSEEKDAGSYVAEAGESSNNDKSKGTITNNQQNETVQHILGHVVDNHVCEDSCADLTLEEDDVEPMDVTLNGETCANISLNEASTGNKDKVCNASNEQIKGGSSNNNEKSFIEKAPVLLTTNMPLSHCFIDRPKYILQLKQKNRQIASLKVKLSSLNKKIEELEDRCIVQERQLSYSFIKRLKTIRKNAAKGDPCATYILEQIRSYSYVNNSKMRWSDSTLTQCAIWCRKAPYAYEYFKKAGFFKLPCLGTVKRFIKKHPEIKFLKNVTKSAPQGEGEGGNHDEDESSSDFDFDESDGQNGNDMSEDENNETILPNSAESSVRQDMTTENRINRKESNEILKATESISNNLPTSNTQDIKTNIKASDASKCIESNGIPITVDTSNLELQEIMLPSGEVVQCYSSNIVNDPESGQYIIIPNVGDQSNVDHEYNVVQAGSMPVILQNIENSQLHVQQDQLIFIANSSDQVECSETEVTSA